MTKVSLHTYPKLNGMHKPFIYLLQAEHSFRKDAYLAACLGIPFMDVSVIFSYTSIAYVASAHLVQALQP